MDRYVYSVEKDAEHGKVVHLSANVYFNDSDISETNYRMAEWKGEYLTIAQVQELISDNYLFDYINERIRSLGDFTHKQVVEICNEYAGTLLHIKDITPDTPCGDYYFDAE